MPEQEVTNILSEGDGSKSNENAHKCYRGSKDKEDWRMGKKALERGAYLLEKGLWSDCSFYVKGGEEPPQTFKCHKVILASASPYFEAMLFGCAKEEGDIKITDISPSTFQIMLHYIYTEVLPEISFDQLLRVGIAANKCLVDELCQQCLKKMGQLLKPENAIEVIQFAQICYCEWLEKDTMKVVQNQTERVLKSEAMLEALQSTLETILKSDVLSVKSEMILWKTAVDWGKRRCEEKGIAPDSKGLREVLETLLQHIRFLSMTPKEFTEGPGQSGVLTTDESLTFLMCIASSEIPFTLSNRFSAVRGKRVMGDMFDIEEKILYFDEEILYIEEKILYNGFRVCLKSSDFVQVKGFEFCTITDAYISGVLMKFENNGSAQSQLSFRGSPEDYKYVVLQNPIFVHDQNINLTFSFVKGNLCFGGYVTDSANMSSTFKRHYLRNSTYIHAVLV